MFSNGPREAVNSQELKYQIKKSIAKNFEYLLTYPLDFNTHNSISMQVNIDY